MGRLQVPWWAGWARIARNPRADRTLEHFGAPRPRAPNGVSVTMFRLGGGSPGTTARTWCPIWRRADQRRRLHLDGHVFCDVGNNISAVAVIGAWNNVIFDGHRDEETEKPVIPVSEQDRIPPSWRRSCDGDGHPLQFADGAHLRSFRLHAYGDADEACPIVRQGSLTAGTIITNAGRGIQMEGTILGLDYRSSAPLNVVVQGDVRDIADRPINQALNVSGTMEADGKGGGLVARTPLFSGTSVWTIDSDGLLRRSSPATASSSTPAPRRHTRTTTISYHDQAALTGNTGVGKLALKSNSTLLAEFVGTGGAFTVRRLA